MHQTGTLFLPSHLSACLFFAGFLSVLGTFWGRRETAYKEGNVVVSFVCLSCFCYSSVGILCLFFRLVCL